MPAEREKTIESVQLDGHFLDVAIEWKWSPLIVVAGNGRAEVSADVETFAGRECSRNGHLRRRTSDLLAVDGEYDVGGCSWLRSLEDGLHDDRMFTGRNLFR